MPRPSKTKGRSPRPPVNTALQSMSGAIDLASIMVGVLVIGIIAGIIAAMVFAVIPWSQDQAAKSDLDAVKTAESVAYAQGSEDGAAKYYTFDDLVGKKLIQESDSLVIGIDKDASCYVAISTSATGNRFYSTNKILTPRPYTSTTTTECVSVNPGGPVAGPDMTICTDPTAVWAIADPLVEAVVREEAGMTGVAGPMRVSDASKVVTSMTFSDPAMTTLDGIQCASDTTSVHITGTQVADLAPVSALKKITAFTLDKNDQVTTLASVSDMPALTNMYVDYNTSLTGLQGVSDLPALEHLSVTFNTGMTDLDASMDLPNLKELYFTANAGTGEINVTGDLPKLTDVYLWQNSGFTSAKLTSKMPSLEHGQIYANTDIAEATFSGWEGATNAQIYQNVGLKKVTMTNLKAKQVHLYQNNEVVTAEFTNLPEVTTMNIQGDALADLTVDNANKQTTLYLDSAPALKRLALSNMDSLWQVVAAGKSDLTDISGVKDLSALTMIVLASNPNLTSFDGMTNLPNLATVIASGSGFDVASVDRFKAAVGHDFYVQR